MMRAIFLALAVIFTVVNGEKSSMTFYADQGQECQIEQVRQNNSRGQGRQRAIGARFKGL